MCYTTSTVVHHPTDIRCRISVGQMYIPSVYSSAFPHAQKSGLSTTQHLGNENAISTTWGYSPANVARRAWSAISSIWAISEPTPTMNGLVKRDSSQTTNVTIAVLVAVFVTLFFALLFWFLYRYGATVRLKESKRRHRHRHGHGRRRSGGSRSSKSMKSGGSDSAPPSPEAGPSEPPPAE